jgi:SAM-dependent methyltransferase
MADSDHRDAEVSAGDVTLATYEAAASLYRDGQPVVLPVFAAFLDQVAELVGAGTALELGSGPGRDAAYLEARGVRVTRSDATAAFVELMRADGHEARRLDVRTDNLGGSYDAVLAMAMLLHLTRPEFTDLLRRARAAVVLGGLLAFTVKEGDGEAWSDAKLDRPRFFTYWRAPAVRAELTRAGWDVLSLDHVDGRREPWLYVIARARPMPG